MNNLGAETAGYTRSGSTLTASFSTPIAYAGTPLKLLQRGAYLNFNTAAFPGGAVPRPVDRPTDCSDQAHRDRARRKFPPPERRQRSASPAAPAYIEITDPGTNTAITRVSLFNFTNTLTLSHYHEDPPGVSGPVVLSFGGASVYNANGFNLNQVFNQTYIGNVPLTLLTGGAYGEFFTAIFTRPARSAAKSSRPRSRSRRASSTDRPSVRSDRAALSRPASLSKETKPSSP